MTEFKPLGSNGQELELEQTYSRVTSDEGSLSVNTYYHGRAILDWRRLSAQSLGGTGLSPEVDTRCLLLRRYPVMLGAIPGFGGRSCGYGAIRSALRQRWKRRTLTEVQRVL